MDVMCTLCVAGEECVYIEYIMHTLCVHYVSQVKSVCTLSTVCVHYVYIVCGRRRVCVH